VGGSTRFFCQGVLPLADRGSSFVSPFALSLSAMTLMLDGKRVGHIARGLRGSQWTTRGRQRVGLVGSVAVVRLRERVMAFCRYFPSA
jgi:hypothetical protein